MNVTDQITGPKERIQERCTLELRIAVDADGKNERLQQLWTVNVFKDGKVIRGGAEWRDVPVVKGV